MTWFVTGGGCLSGGTRRSWGRSRIGDGSPAQRTEFPSKSCPVAPSAGHAILRPLLLTCAPPLSLSLSRRGREGETAIVATAIWLVETRSRVLARDVLRSDLPMRLLSSLLRPFGGGGGNGASGREGREGLLWYRDFGRCVGGEFSMAVIQANQVLEDQSRLESGPFGTFVGVFDGHGGPEAARFVCDHLYTHFREISSGPQGVTCDGIRQAFLATEERFIQHVSHLWNTRPDMATTGSCCLVGIICQGTLYVANLGDSRAILGRKVGSTGEIAAIALSTEHNANVEAVREELKAQHPNDPQIVVLKHGVWRVKGIIQVSRSIGDAYMKHAQYNREPINSKFRIAEPMNMPILTANPSIISHHLQPSDSFLVFASDGLWEHLSDQKVVEIVHSHPRAGSARRLIKAALLESARKREMRYSDLKRIDKKVRRHFHDDITVIVIFLNREHTVRGSQAPQVSIRSALDH